MLKTLDGTADADVTTPEQTAAPQGAELGNTTPSDTTPSDTTPNDTTPSDAAPNDPSASAQGGTDAEAGAIHLSDDMIAEITDRQRDLRLLLRYVTQSSEKEVSQSAVAVAQRGLLFDPHKPDQAGLHALYVALDTLSRAVKPVTAESLRLRDEYENDHGRKGSARMSSARRIVWANFALSIVTLAIIIGLSAADAGKPIAWALYGLLGACAYVMRQATDSLRDCTFSLTTGVRYGIRQLLGAMMGVIVPLLAGKDGVSLGGITLPTEAVAFLAGFGVESVFTALDSIVQLLREFLGRRAGKGGGDGRIDITSEVKEAPAPAATPVLGMGGIR